MNVKLITPEEFVSYRDISKKIDTDKINEQIDLTQESDVYNDLGGFYFDLIRKSTEASYLPLMDGCEFQYNGDWFVHRGIKRYLADLVYARYVYIVNVNFTPFGAVQKFSNDSTGIDRNVIRDLSKQAKIDANIKFKTIQKYLLSEPNIFSRYCKENSRGMGFNEIKISKL